MNTFLAGPQWTKPQFSVQVHLPLGGKMCPVSLLHRIEIGCSTTVVPIARLPTQIAILLQITQRPLDGTPGQV